MKEVTKRKSPFRLRLFALFSNFPANERARQPDIPRRCTLPVRHDKHADRVWDMLASARLSLALQQGTRRRSDGVGSEGLPQECVLVVD